MSIQAISLDHLSIHSYIFRFIILKAFIIFDWVRLRLMLCETSHWEMPVSNAVWTVLGTIVLAQMAQRKVIRSFQNMKYNLSTSIKEKHNSIKIYLRFRLQPGLFYYLISWFFSEFVAILRFSAEYPHGGIAANFTPERRCHFIWHFFALTTKVVKVREKSANRTSFHLWIASETQRNGPGSETNHIDQQWVFHKFVQSQNSITFIVMVNSFERFPNRNIISAIT